ncbi:hypothetical protein COT77_02865 [Candidatus Berkelbacteria bacterium CG10_big_fil_rev_8_21_14_0_10_41_12]|uniref:Nudix hydrolase domain-containing protein n=1 Tax=Candidatus Berkelbacteria bacterium CG10_big_fil_rev_8_21_14_0_10_41_12 TaxID=1974513 RepID=A0A2M6WWT8_9BACT|nr:MAG: hypothetical protein COT77_02865 [Candidatus Berkelbacteria bacterium CG10_big_fil_rev_8_21_14_0_10_41_12]
MKIVIVGSAELADKIIFISEELKNLGYETEIPYTVSKIKDGKFTTEQFRKWKEEKGGDYFLRDKSRVDFIKRYYNLIKNSDAILVMNCNKNGIKNYIGGNALMELGFAYVLDKPIYLYNPIPKMSYTDEIKAVKPIIINGNLKKIKNREKCDHKSAGMLVWKNSQLLLIERKRYPWGFAPPAGHVDDSSSFGSAARRELEEEVGLKAKKLKLVAEGRKENKCHRENGNWHYWKIYEVEVQGNIKKNVKEVKQIGWYGKDKFANLAKRTQKYLAGEIQEDKWQESPGIEPVWHEWLKELKIID